MSLIKKCDRCGNVYDHYGINPTFGNTKENAGKIQENGFSVIYWLCDEPKFKTIHGYDLCPKCLEELGKWFNNPDATVNIFKCTPYGNVEVDTNKRKDNKSKDIKLIVLKSSIPSLNEKEAAKVTMSVKDFKDILEKESDDTKICLLDPIDLSYCGINADEIETIFIEHRR